jgi:asparaginyl-tRNA synthetase
VVQAAEEYPIALKEHGVDYILDNRHLWIRMPSQGALLRVRAVVIAAIHEWLTDNGFIHMDTPILTPAAMRRDDDALRHEVISTRDGLSGAEVAALQRGQHLRVQQGLLLRADIPRGEVQDAPPPHRVLDGGAGVAFCDSTG